MNHTILYKRKGFYGAFPVLTHLSDGRLTVGIPVAPFHDHYAVGDWLVLLSEDEGETWQQSDDPTLPDNWPGTSPREIYDRFAAVMPDGTYLCAGTVGWQAYPAEQQAEVEAQGLFVRPHPNDENAIMVGSNRLFVQRSTDKGRRGNGRSGLCPASTISRRFRVQRGWRTERFSFLSTVPPPMLGGELTSGGQRMAERRGVG